MQLQMQLKSDAWAAPPVRQARHVAVPLLREVRQNKILPYHNIIVKNLKHIGDLILFI